MSPHGLPEEGSDRPSGGTSGQLLLAVVGSVCGTLITSALDTSPEVRLIGAALGSAVPTLITFVGPYRHLRVVAGIGVTLVALLVTVTGFTLFDHADDRRATFPMPEAIEPEPGGDGPDDDDDPLDDDDDPLDDPPPDPQPETETRSAPLRKPTRQPPGTEAFPVSVVRT